MRAFALSLLLTVVAACGGSGSSSAPTTTAAIGHQLLAPTAAAGLLRTPPQGLVILDVRTPEEFAAGHIAGAVDVDVNSGTFPTDVGKLDRDTIYFVYCHSGHRSAIAVAQMQQTGFRSLYELDGGIAAWQQAGLPVTTN